MIIYPKGYFGGWWANLMSYDSDTKIWTFWVQLARFDELTTYYIAKGKTKERWKFPFIYRRVNNGSFRLNGHKNHFVIFLGNEGMRFELIDVKEYEGSVMDKIPRK